MQHHAETHRTEERPCGNPQCCTSTGIHEGLTFGHGKLDDLGYWEFPCRTCAAAWDAEREKIKQQVKAAMVEAYDRSQLEAEEYVRNAEWLNLPAWPYE